MAIFSQKHSKFSVMYQILPLCKKHGSYMCRAALRNFVRNIPALLSFVRKIPTHDIMCRNNSHKCRNYSYINSYTCKNDSYTCKNDLYTCRNYSYTARRVLHFVPSIGIFLTKFNSVGIFPTKFSKNSQ